MSEESSLPSDQSDDEDSVDYFNAENDRVKSVAVRATTHLLPEKSNAPRALTRSDASKCLYALGKCDNGTGYAYLAIDVSNKSLTDVSVIQTFSKVNVPMTENVPVAGQGLRAREMEIQFFMHVQGLGLLPSAFGYWFLLRANVSGNRLSHEALAVLASMPFLLMLEADANDLLSADFGPMARLQVLTLNKNSLQDVSKIAHPLVESLELSYNRLNSIDLNPHVLKNLKNLQLRGNTITKIGSSNYSYLERLYLAENEIEGLKGVDNLVSLKTLHLRDNRLGSLDGFTPNCARLRYLNIRKNSIALMSEVKKLSCLPALETLVVSENPVVTRDENEEDENDETDNYRATVLALLPGLKRLDKHLVTDEERREAEHLQRQWRAEGNIE